MRKQSYTWLRDHYDLFFWVLLKRCLSAFLNFDNHSSTRKLMHFILLRGVPISVLQLWRVKQEKLPGHTMGSCLFVYIYPRYGKMPVRRRPIVLVTWSSSNYSMLHRTIRTPSPLRSNILLNLSRTIARANNSSAHRKQVPWFVINVPCQKFSLFRVFLEARGRKQPPAFPYLGRTTFFVKLLRHKGDRTRTLDQQNPQDEYGNFNHGGHVGHVGDHDLCCIDSFVYCCVKYGYGYGYGSLQNQRKYTYETHSSCYLVHRLL